MRADYLRQSLQQQDIYVVVFEKRFNIYTGEMRVQEYELYAHFKQAEEALDIIYTLIE